MTFASSNYQDTGDAVERLEHANRELTSNLTDTQKRCSDLLEEARELRRQVLGRDEVLRRIMASWGQERHFLDVGDWMQTVGGRPFFPLMPRPQDIDIVDAAHALSFICRFGGHTPSFYSVCDHSLLVSEAIEEADGSIEEQLWGLLHDLAEAYIGDVIWPLKRAPEMAGYRLVEERVERAIAERFQLPLPRPPIVKKFDLILLATEKRDLLDKDATNGAALEWAAAREQLGGWVIDGVAEPLPYSIKLFLTSPEVSRKRFVERFERLMAARPLRIAPEKVLPAPMPQCCGVAMCLNPHRGALGFLECSKCGTSQRITPTI